MEEHRHLVHYNAFTQHVRIKGGASVGFTYDPYADSGKEIRMFISTNDPASPEPFELYLSAEEAKRMARRLTDMHRFWWDNVDLHRLKETAGKWNSRR